jgi:hypothetical protein
MTDLEQLAGEAAPRSEATCKQLERRIVSRAGTIAYGIGWFYVANMIATPVLLIGIHVTGDHGSRPAAYGVMAAWIGTFVLAWLPFARWMRRRHRGARLLIREGQLVDAVLELGKATPYAAARATSASIRFSSADGREHRALFALDAVGASPVGSHRALFAPGADRCLVFSPAGKAIPAKMAHDLSIERGDGRTLVTLRRGRSEKIVTGILTVLMIELAYFAVVLTWLQRPAELRCDRATDNCTLTGSDIFFQRWSWSVHASRLSGSRLRKNDKGGIAWEMTLADGSSRSLGGIAGADAQRAEFQRWSEALGAFIRDGNQRTFDATFFGMTSMSPAVWIIVLLLMGYPLARLVNGWRTTLTFDGAAGELEIVRAPALYSRARETRPLSSVARVEAVRGVFWYGLAAMSLTVLRLVDSDGKILFQRRLTLVADLAPELATINAALGPR